MLARMWRKRNTPPLLLGLQTGTTTLDISLVFPQKIGPEDPAILLLAYTQNVVQHVVRTHDPLCS